MEHHAGIDVSLEQSSVRVVDGTGRIVREAKVPSEPEALVRFLHQLGLPATSPATTSTSPPNATGCSSSGEP
jgi:hypothetical protein